MQGWGSEGLSLCAACEWRVDDVMMSENSGRLMLAHVKVIYRKIGISSVCWRVQTYGGFV